MSFLFGGFGGRKDSATADEKKLNEIDKVLHRIESVTLIADRRDGLRALKKIAPDHRVEIAAHGLDILMDVLEKDRTDQELVSVVLEILNIVMADTPNVEAELSDGAKKAKAASSNSALVEKSRRNEAASQGGQLTEIFLKKSQHLTLILDFVKELNFQIRFQSIRLLCIMANNSSHTLQNALLTVPGGMSNLMDLLTDNREIIRNDALLLLCFITHNNPSLQKIVAFSKAFETILDMVRDEGCSEGGVVVEDCLVLLSNLLTKNASNIKLFKEDGCINKLCQWYVNDKSSTASWTEERKKNAIRMLGVIRSLVWPSLSAQGQVVRPCQDAIRKCGLLGHICDILMTPAVPLPVLVQALDTVAECIRGNQESQRDFAEMEAPLNPPRPALSILLLSMFNDRQSFSLRLAVLYILKSFLFKNDSMQLSILQSMTQDPLQLQQSPGQPTLGHLLAGNLFSSDNLNQWCSAIAFLHCVMENGKHKELLLNLQFAPSPTLPPVTMIAQCGNILRDGALLKGKIAVLQLLIVWLSECSSAVSVFLNIPQITMMLLTQILDTSLEPTQRLFQSLCAFLFSVCILYNEDSTSRHDLLDLIHNRIGFETCRERIVELSRHDNFVKCSEGPDPTVESLDLLLLDHDFVRFSKAIEGKICECLDPHYEERMLHHKERQADALNQQRELVQSKDNRITDLQAQLNFAHSRINESARQIDDLRRRSEVLTGELQSKELEIDALRQELHHYQTILQNQSNSTSVLHNENMLLRQQLQEKSETIKQLQENGSQFKELQQEVEELRSLSSQQQQQIASYYSYFESEQNASGGNNAAIVIAEKTDLSAKVAHLDQLLYSWQSECSRLQGQIDHLQMELAQKDSSHNHQPLNEAASKELDQLRSKYADLNAEHADLLELLTDNDDKIKIYRHRMRQLGEQVSDDDS